MTTRVFLDTVFVTALLNPRDQYHQRAMQFVSYLETSSEVWTTEAVLVEVGNSLGAVDRDKAVGFIHRCYRTANVFVKTVDTALLGRAVRLYEERHDKTWGLTDCISFVVMRDEGLTDALTADRHFLQAGFRPLLLDDA